MTKHAHGAPSQTGDLRLRRQRVIGTALFTALMASVMGVVFTGLIRRSRLDVVRVIATFDRPRRTALNLPLFRPQGLLIAFAFFASP
jgi:hypothetical protein